MSHPSRPDVIAVNQTAGNIFLADLGATVPASSTLTLSSFFYLYEIQASFDLLASVQADELLINDGTTTLSKAASIQYITGVASAQDLQDGVTGPASSTANQIPKFADTTGKALVASPVTINGSNQLDMAGAKVVNSATPTASTDLATKGYVDSMVSGIDAKGSVRAATTGSITLSGTQTVDGIALIAGERILVKDQGTGSQNGIYVVAAGAWSRSTDMAAASSAAGVYVIVEEGTTNSDVGYLCTNNVGSDVVGTDALVFTRFSTFQLASVAPNDVTKASASVGASSRAAREDHKHDISTAAPASGAVAIGNAASEGSASSLARSDHTHAVSAGTPVSIGTTNSEGAATTFARSDHVHDTVFSAVNNALSEANASINVNNQKITGLATPSASSDAATKDYVDGAVTGGSDWKNSVRVATTGNITLSGAQTIDGVSAIAGDRVLVKAQSTGSQNGIYVVAAGAWSRAADADSSAKVTSGLTVYVSEGSTLAGSSWTLTTVDTITLDSTALVFGASQLTSTTPSDVTKSAASAGTSPFSARLDHKHDISTAAPGTSGLSTASSEGSSSSLARADHTHQSNTAPSNISKSAAVIGTSGEPARADHKHDIDTAAPGSSSLATSAAEGTSTSMARADHVHQSNTAPSNVTKSAAAIGTSGEPARADHKHDISTAAPSQGIGAANSEGTSTSLARADHNHLLRETSGPTDLSIAAIGDGEIIRRSGTTIAGGVGRVYPSNTVDPSSPTPSQGDRYFNTNLQMWMVYDGSRSKFLSEESVVFDFGRNGDTAAGAYYRGIDSKVMSSTSGFHAFFNGTVVGVSYSRSDSDAVTFQVDANGSSIATLSSSAVSGRSTSLDGNFAAGDILAVKNAGANISSAVQGSVKVKWRA